MKKIRVAQLIAQRCIELREATCPDPMSGEVRIRPEYVGVCGSDVHFFEHGRIGQCVVRYPFILGHECAGIVTAVGPNVTNLAVGDRVTIEPGIACHSCRFCRDGRYNLCPQVKFLSTPPYDGVLREEFNHPATLTYRLPKNVSTQAGALIEPLAVGLYAVKRAELRPGANVAILGGGCIGLVTLLACISAGAKSVVVSDLYESRLETAKELGATAVFCPNVDNPTEQLLRLSPNSRGFDTVFETAGSRVTAAQTSELVGRGGKIIAVGNVLGEVPFSFRDLYLKEAEVRAVFRYCNVFEEAIWQLSSGRICVDKLVSDLFPFEEAQKAFERAAGDKANVIKAVIQMK